MIIGELFLLLGGKVPGCRSGGSMPGIMAPVGPKADANTLEVRLIQRCGMLVLNLESTF